MTLSNIQLSDIGLIRRDSDSAFMFKCNRLLIVGFYIGASGTRNYVTDLYFKDYVLRYRTGQ